MTFNGRLVCMQLSVASAGFGFRAYVESLQTFGTAMGVFSFFAFGMFEFDLALHLDGQTIARFLAWLICCFVARLVVRSVV